MKKSIRNLNAPRSEERRGVAVLEAAVIMPVMLVLVLGTIEMGTALRASTIMQSAVREAGRLASMNWENMVTAPDTPNAKMERDLRNYVTASGLPGSALTVAITHAEGDDVGQPFNIADSNNDLKLMNITLTLPYGNISLFPTHTMSGKSVSATLVMRAGMGAGIAQ